MAINDMTFNQLATVLNSIYTQATGQAPMAITDTSSFVTVAQTALKTGLDPIYRAINQVLSKTIYSARPYSRKFKGIEADSMTYGNHVRKLAIGAHEFVDADPFKAPVAATGTDTPEYGIKNGVDQQIQRKVPILQTNFYGQNVYEDFYTIYDHQLNVAFSSPDEFQRFIQMIVQEQSNMFEQARENIARATVSNFIGGIISENDSNRCVKLLTEYNTLTGLALDDETVYQPANFAPFMRWVYSRIATLSAMMMERSELYQTTVNGIHVLRHTPVSDQRVYLYAPARYQIDSQVLSTTHHDNYLKMPVTETVNYWQSIQTPDAINVTAGRIGSDGAVKSGAVNVSGVFGVVFDKEAMGYTNINSSIKPAPYNARGEYQTFWHHEVQKVWNDHTEKGVVLLLQ